MGDRPSLIAYVVREKSDKNKKAAWVRIGAAWPVKKGEGLNLTLDALPTDGRITLLPPKSDDEA